MSTPVVVAVTFGTVLAVVLVAVAAVVVIGWGRRREDRRAAAVAQLYGSLIDELPDRMVRWGLSDFVIRACNAAWSAEFGLTPAEVIGRRMDELLSDNELEVFQAEARKMGPGWVGSTEAVRSDPSGAPVREAWTDRVVRTGDGAFEVITVGRDITRRAAAEAALARSEARQRAVVQSLHEGVLVFDADGRCVEANRAAARILGVGRPEALLGGSPDVLPLADASGALLADDAHPVVRALAGGSPVTDQLLRLADHGRWVEVDVLTVIGSGPGADGPHHGVVCSVADVTARRQAEDALAARERELRTLVEAVPVGIYRVDPSGGTTYVNPTWERLAGLPASEAMGMGWMKAVHPDDVRLAGDDLEQVVEAGGSSATEMRYLHADGTVVIVQAALVELRSPDGTSEGFLGSVTDVTEQVRLRQAIAESEARLRTLADGASDVVFRLALDPLRFEYVNDAVAGITGLDPSAFYADAEVVVGLTIQREDLDDLVTAAEAADGAAAVRQQPWRHVDGTVRWMEVRARLTRDPSGRPSALDAIARDVTARREAEEALERLAHQDPLTGLPNRRAVTLALEAARTARREVAVLFVDLDGFKAVNDELGHAVGDELLQHVAARLGSLTRGDDLVARLGGDEFVVVTEPGGSRPLAARVVESLSTPFVLPGGVQVRVSASVGLAFSRPGERPERTLRAADEAMYEAKRAGKNAYRAARR